MLAKSKGLKMREKNSKPDFLMYLRVYVEVGPVCRRNAIVPVANCTFNSDDIKGALPHLMLGLEEQIESLVEEELHPAKALKKENTKLRRMLAGRARYQQKLWAALRKVTPEFPDYDDAT